jgi:ankyrin repeat protein
MSFLATPLVCAVSCKYPLKMTKLLLDYSADAQYRDSHGMSPLSKVCTYFTRSTCTPKEFQVSVEIAQLLVRHGAKPITKVSSKDSVTHLMLATISGNLPLIKFFVEDLGCPLSEVTSHGHKALSFAKTHKYSDIIEFLEKAHRNEGTATITLALPILTRDASRFIRLVIIKLNIHKLHSGYSKCVFRVCLSFNLIRWILFSCLPLDENEPCLLVAHE